MDELEELLTSPEVCRLAGCTYRQLDYWTHENVVAPSRPATGSGSVRGWTVEEAALVRVCATLAKLGTPTPTITLVVQGIRAFPELWSGRALVTPEGGIRPSGVTSGIDGWHLDLRACRDHVGCPPVPWPAVG